MIIYRENRFACLNCIKGHRAVNCMHLEKPLLNVRRLHKNNSTDNKYTLQYRLGFKKDVVIGSLLPTDVDDDKNIKTFIIDDKVPVIIYITVASVRSSNVGDLFGICTFSHEMFEVCNMEVISRFGSIIYDDRMNLQSEIFLQDHPINRARDQTRVNPRRAGARVHDEEVIVQAEDRESPGKHDDCLYMVTTGRLKDLLNDSNPSKNPVIPHTVPKETLVEPIGVGNSSTIFEPNTFPLIGSSSINQLEEGREIKWTNQVIFPESALRSTLEKNK